MLRERHAEAMVELLSTYLDGRLTGPDLTVLEAHLAGCANCRTDLAALRETVRLLRALPAVEPSRSFVLGAADQPLGRRSRPGTWRRAWGSGLALAAAAGLALAVGLGAGSPARVEQQRSRPVESAVQARPVAVPRSSLAAAPVLADRTGEAGAGAPDAKAPPQPAVGAQGATGPVALAGPAAAGLTALVALGAVVRARTRRAP